MAKAEKKETELTKSLKAIANDAGITSESLKPKLTPVILPSSHHLDLLTPESNFEPHPGEYHLVSVDHAGNEIPGSDFSVGTNTYNRSFKDKPGFKVKKKAK